jgi:hypothetical protein
MCYSGIIFLGRFGVITAIILVLTIKPAIGYKYGNHSPAICNITPTAYSRLAIQNDGYNIANSLPAGYVKDGTQDYTTYVQGALLSHSHLIFPDFPILINDSGLIIGSDKIIDFLPGAVLMLAPSNKKNYTILKIDRASNVVLNDPVIKGDRYTHIGNEGEWGTGIGIYSSANIIINNPHVSACWGDGLYIGTSKGSNSINSNISINNASLTHNRRNGITIISVNGLSLTSPYAGYCDGTPPMCGIDFEPNKADNELKNIKVTNAKTEFNKGPGISIVLKNLYGQIDKQVDIRIESPQDLNSNIGLRATATQTRRLATESIFGNITITSPQWSGNAQTPMQANLPDTNIKLRVSKPVVIDTYGKKLGNSSVLSLLTYKSNMNSNANYSITF